jgi:hypothetical protein
MVARQGLLSKVVVVHHWGLSPWVIVVSVQPAVIAVELELAVAEVAKVVVILARAAVARLLGVAEGLVAEGLVAEE